MKIPRKTIGLRLFRRIIKCFLAVALTATVVLILTSRTGYALEGARCAGGFEEPLAITAPPGDTGRLFVAEQTGKIKIIKLPQRTVNAIPFLDLSAVVSNGGEQGRLGLAFDPNYAVNGRFYASYTTRGGSFRACVSHVSEFTVSSDPDIADPSSEATLILLDQPQVDHNVDWL